MSVGKKNRSPNYPVVHLESALDYARALKAFARGMHPVPLGAAVEKAWQMKKGSTYGRQVAAALKSFGLVLDEGSGEKRHIRITEDANKILDNHRESPLLLRKAVYGPKIYRELLEKWHGDLPPEVTIREYLVHDRDGNRFNEKVVDTFIDLFVASANFANPFGDDIMGKLGEEDDDSSTKEVGVGDFVQWNSQGMDRFKVPKKVVGLDEHEGETFAFVEGEKAGFPVDQLTVTDPPEGAGSQTKSASAPTNPFYREPEPEGRHFSVDLPSGNSISVRVKNLLTADECEQIKNLLEFSLRDPNSKPASKSG